MSRPIRKPGYSVEHGSWFIKLTQGVIALVDGDMVPAFSQHCWCATRQGRRWYAVRTQRCKGSKQKLHTMHRVVMKAPPGLDVDHRIHHSPDALLIDNRRANLRICTRSQNGANRAPKPGGSSRFKGVSWFTIEKKWHACLGYDGRRIDLGYFTDEIEAAKAYDAAAIEYFGEFAFTNENAGLFEGGDINASCANNRQKSFSKSSVLHDLKAMHGVIQDHGKFIQGSGNV